VIIAGTPEKVAIQQAPSLSDIPPVPPFPAESPTTASTSGVSRGTAAIRFALPSCAGLPS
jgi:hypothetical protein